MQAYSATGTAVGAACAADLGRTGAVAAVPRPRGAARYTLYTGWIDLGSQVPNPG